MNILLAVDGSDCAHRAVTHLIEHLAPALRESPTVHLLHVHAPIPIGRVQAHIGQETLERYYREEGDALLQPVAARLAAAGLHSVTHLHVGDAPMIIAKLARELVCEWIVMGTHGRGAVSAVVLGSVASKVLHLSERPLLLVK
jgi:nucleotide-binding universal stress UspA family protein